MGGMLKVARFSALELIRGRVFKILLVLALIANFLICFLGYYTVSRNPEKYGVGENRHHGYNSQFDEPSDQTAPMGNVNEMKDQAIYGQIATFLRWFIYAIFIFFGNFLAIFSSIGLMSHELERRSIYTLISKPLSRSAILFGKLLGVMICQVFYAVVMLLAAQIFFKLSGAGFQWTLAPAFAIGFINFIIFGTFSMFLAIHMRQIQATVVTIVTLWISTHGGVIVIQTISKEVFKFGKWVDYALLILPQQKNIGAFALSFVLDKYQQDLIGEFKEMGMLELVSKDSHMLTQPLIWLGCVILACYLTFFRKEFD